MSSRHLGLIRDLSVKNREKEEQQRREELRSRKREHLLRERVSQRQRSPVPAPLAPIESPSAPAPPDDSSSKEERRQWRARCNSDIERRQEEVIRNLQQAKQAEREKKEQDRLKHQLRAHKAKSYLLDRCQNPELKEYLETKSRPKALPKLPTGPARSSSLMAARKSTTSASASANEGEDAGSDSASDDAAGQDRLSPPPRPEFRAPPRPGSAAPPEAAEGTSAGSGQAVDAAPEGSAAPSGAESREPASAAGAASSGPTKQREPQRSQKQQGSINKFLDRLRTAKAAGPCSDMAEWKRRNGCPPDKRVFICCGGYPDFRDALLARGWFQNPDKDSRYFDLKWGMATNIDHENLLPNQVVNHFDRCRDLTTKVGLTISLRNAAWHCGVDVDAFYPRAFDLFDPLERANFVTDFKFSKAESILREFLRQVDAGAAMTFSKDVIHTALKICTRTLTDVDDVLDCPTLAEGLCKVDTSEWALLKKVCLDDVERTLEGALKERDLEELINKRLPMTDAQREKEAERKKQQELEKGIVKKEKKKKKKKKPEEPTEPPPLTEPMSAFDNPRGKHFIGQSRSLLDEMGQKSRQHRISGGRNVWIVKPSGKSRGRGIQVMRELDEIFQTTKSDGFQWVIQKYIEQPQLIHGYKFDIRQWVLVTDWNPLTIYMWRHPYLRFAGQKYDESMADRSEYVHLTNNSIIHDMSGFHKKNEDLQMHGYMWFRQQYEEWLHGQFCKCETHRTPWLTPPPYTCESFGVRFEDVFFVAKDEEDEDADEDDDPTLGMPRQGGVTRTASSTTASTAASTAAASTTASTESPTSSSSPTSRSMESSSSGAESGGDAPAPAPSAEAADAAKPAAKPQEEEVPPPPAPPSAERPASSRSNRPRSRGGCCKGGASGQGDKRQEPCENIFDTVIRKQMEEIVTWSLSCVVDSIAHRKNTVELYGYDFMVSNGSDGKPEAWLIEVNSSPACDYSTPVTCPLVKKMMEDTAKVMVDLKENPDAPTGEWELLQHSFNKTVPQRCLPCSQLEVCGKRISAPKGFKRKKKKEKRAASKAAPEDADEDDEARDDDEGDGDSDANGDGDADEEDSDS